MKNELLIILLAIFLLLLNAFTGCQPETAAEPITDSTMQKETKKVEEAITEAALEEQSLIDLIGIWQDHPYIAAGWSDNYQFFADGSFKYNYNQMICDKRIISLIGKWQLENSGLLKLAVKEKTIIEGGELVQADGSCATDEMISGGEIVTVVLEEAELQEIQLKGYHIDKESEGEGKASVIFNDTQFWQMRSDPDSY